MKNSEPNIYRECRIDRARFNRITELGEAANVSISELLDRCMAIGADLVLKLQAEDIKRCPVCQLLACVNPYHIRPTETGRCSCGLPEPCYQDKDSEAGS